jgi:hypothetical protein
VCVPSNFFSVWINAESSSVTIRLLKENNILANQTALDIVSQCMERICRRWEKLWDEFNIRFTSGEHANFMNPEKYVHILYDDGTFQRSRFYFWAIGCLSAFEETLTVNMKALKDFRQRMLEDPTVTPQQREDMRHIDESLEADCAKLEEIARQIKRRLESVIALRDGVSAVLSSSILFFVNRLPFKLFSARGVMESRQSRILSEIVRLLTFVTIFFLPLALCAVSSLVHRVRYHTNLTVHEVAMGRPGC